MTVLCSEFHRCDGTVDQAMGLYKEMLSFGVCVDHYTYNGLLTTMAHKHASLAQVEDLVREMSRWEKAGGRDSDQPIF